LIINHIRKKYGVKKEKLKCYARRVSELMDPSTVSIYFIPREKNQKEDSLTIVSYLFNIDDSQRQDTYQVKTIF
jgi:hypothetical protein